jgi:hypothetical protein
MAIFSFAKTMEFTSKTLGIQHGDNIGVSLTLLLYNLSTIAELTVTELIPFSEAIY